MSTLTDASDLSTDRHQLLADVDYQGETKKFHPEEVSAMIMTKMKEDFNVDLAEEQKSEKKEG